jgi:superfamily II DNA or RNA helicase
LVFHERIEAAKTTARIFERAGVRTALELSTDPPVRRAEALRDFRSGTAQSLIAVRTLDEGIDLPDTKIAVIAAGSASRRQRLQRIGRVVRPTGEPALVISLVARGTNEELVIAANDAALIGSDRVQFISRLNEGVWY